MRSKFFNRSQPQHNTMTSAEPPKPSTAHRPKKAITRTIKQFSPRKKPPAPIAIPKPAASRTLPVAAAINWVAVELSNFPPNFARQDVQAIFRDYNVSPGFTLPNTTRFAYPFRTKVFLAGVDEASRAVKGLDGRMVGGRRISVRMIDRAAVEEEVVGVANLAEELRIGIISKLRLQVVRPGNGAPTKSIQTPRVCTIRSTLPRSSKFGNM